LINLFYEEPNYFKVVAWTQQTKTVLFNCSLNSKNVTWRRDASDFIVILDVVTPPPLPPFHHTHDVFHHTRTNVL
jgi:hypothetical protein